MRFLIDFNELPSTIRLGILQITSNQNILKYYSKSPYLEERIAVAKNTNTSLNILKKLFSDSSVSVTYAVLKNPSWNESDNNF